MAQTLLPPESLAIATAHVTCDLGYMAAMVHRMVAHAVIRPPLVHRLIGLFQLRMVEVFRQLQQAVINAQRWSSGEMEDTAGYPRSLHMQGKGNRDRLAYC